MMQPSPYVFSSLGGPEGPVPSGRIFVRHAIVGVGVHLLLLMNLIPGIFKNETVLCIPFGLGFGHLTMASVWLSIGKSRERVPFFLAIVMVELLMMLLITSSNAQSNISLLIVILVASVGYTILTTGTMLTVRKLSRIDVDRQGSDASATREDQLQYGTKDLMIAMLVVSLFSAFFQWSGTTKIAPHETMMRLFFVFGLICSFYYILTWPIFVACLGQKGARLLSVIACVISVVVVVSEPYIFIRVFRVSGPMNPRFFFVLLDVPLLISVLSHSLLARAHGYRLLRGRKLRV